MTQDTVKQDVKQETVSSNDTTTAVKQDDKQNYIPQARFNEVNAQYKEVSQKLAEYESKEEEARKKQLAADGKQSEIIAEQDAELKVFREEKVKREAERKEKHAKLIEQLPENERAIYSGLSLEALEEHLKIQMSVNEKVNTDTRQPSRINKGIVNEDYTTMNEKERREVWPSIQNSYKIN